MQPAPVQPVAQAWDEGYRAGIDDERKSEASIGIAGFDAKVEPARNNPYCTTPPAQPAPVQECLVHGECFGGKCIYTTPPAAQRQSARNAWVGLTDEDKLHIEIMGGKSDVMLAEMVEAKLKEKNT
jgi:hypothetical protein